MMKKLTLLVLLAACGGDSKATPDAAAPPPIDAGDPPCFSGTATTNDQLLNACVNEAVVTRIIKHPVLPLMNPDGTLPPIP